MEYNQLDENIDMPDINDINDKFSSEVLLNLFIKDSLNRKEKDNQ